MDFELFNSIKNIADEIKLFRPSLKEENYLSSKIKIAYRKITGKKLLKYSLLDAWIISRELKRLLEKEYFDLIFSYFSNPMCFYNSKTPLVLCTDTTFIGQHLQWPLYGDIGMQISVWQERRVFSKATKIITFSKWCKNDLITNYKILPKKIIYFPIPAALPAKHTKSNHAILNIKCPLNILLVAREFHRKGVDIAIKIVNRLNELDYNSKLVICGLKGQSEENIEYVGPYDKSINRDLIKYINLYKNAHLLIHPARFEAAGITPSEAAAFATPTITNAVGGLGTTVKDGVSGYVLPPNSIYSEYVEKIIHLVNNPDIYVHLCETTKNRYQRELNWLSHRRLIKKVLSNAISDNKNKEQIKLYSDAIYV